MSSGTVPADPTGQASVCGRLFAGIEDSNIAGGMDVCLLCVRECVCVCYQVEVSVTGRSLVQNILTNCDMSN